MPASSEDACGLVQVQIGKNKLQNTILNYLLAKFNYTKNLSRAACTWPQGMQGLYCIKNVKN